MKIFLRLLVIYLFFIIQYTLYKFPFEILLLLLVILSLYDEPFYALLNALWAGVLLDLTAPPHLGFHIIFFTLVAYGLSNVRRALYNNRTYLLIIVALVLTIKYLLGLTVLKARTQFLSWFISFIILLILAIPLDFLITKVILRKWPSTPLENLY
ncbi:MAG: hypothetical protein NZ601_05075 [candidate division WOR-3 bacterium]|nr:hypothetical protein [candidate division WOR-3 bacterium]MCX7757062.1 hypothetical protein [candidate division WOR-3 bacterium]MDW7987239.1 hypothetical protein [candidate division WOR-3 bacterium]